MSDKKEKPRARFFSSLITYHSSLITYHLLLHFPKHQVFQEGVVRGEARDGEAGEAVAEAALEDEAAREGGGRGRGDAERRGAPPGLEHLARGQGRVALADHPVVVGGVAHAEVLEVAGERLDARARAHLHGLVDVSALPAPFRPV